MVVGLLSVLFFLLGFLWVPGPGLCLTKWTNWSISVDLLVAAETGLHGRGLLLVSEKIKKYIKNIWKISEKKLPEGWRVGQGCDGGVRSELRFWQSEVAKYRGVLAGHGEEGVLPRGRQGEARARDGFLRLSGRHRPRLRQRFIFFQDAGCL